METLPSAFPFLLTSPGAPAAAAVGHNTFEIIHAVQITAAADSRTGRRVILLPIGTWHKSTDGEHYMMILFALFTPCPQTEPYCICVRHSGQPASQPVGQPGGRSDSQSSVALVCCAVHGFTDSSSVYTSSGRVSVHDGRVIQAGGE